MKRSDENAPALNAYYSQVTLSLASMAYQREDGVINVLSIRTAVGFDSTSILQ